MSLLRASAGHVPFADPVFDTVVMTWTLCGIANPVAALIEMRRVLKPGARLVFVEHGLSPETRISRMLMGFRLGRLVHHAQHFWTTGFQKTQYKERGQTEEHDVEPSRVIPRDVSLYDLC